MKSIVAIALFVASLCVSWHAAADPVRLIVSIGHRNGQPGEAPLKHAARDAERVRDTFVQLGGVQASNATLLQEPTALAISQALVRATEIARKYKPEEVSIVVYYSGHGDREDLHLGNERLPVAELKRQLADVPARFHMFVSDACRTTRQKGVSVEDPFPIHLDEDVAKGSVVLQASSDGEAAQESDELRSAIFTHYWIAALSGAGDTNGDGRVTLEESYSYAEAQTMLRSVRGLGNVQRPEATVSLTENRPLVLTVVRGMSRLRLPRAKDVRYYVFQRGSHALMTDVWSDPMREVELAVPAGGYVVYRRSAGVLGSMDIDLVRGVERTLSPSEFRGAKEEVLAQKGGEVAEPASNQWSLAYSTFFANNIDLGHHLEFRYSRHLSDTFSVSGSIQGSVGSTIRSDQDASTTQLGTSLDVVARASLGSTRFHAFAGPTGRIVWQSIRQRDGTQLIAAGYNGTTLSRAGGAGVEAVVGIGLPISEKVEASLDPRAEVLWMNIDGRIRPIWFGGVGLRLAYSH